MSLPKLVAATAGLAAGATAAVLLGVTGAATWVGDRLHADFVPVDRSYIGPNLLASAIQAAAVFIIAALVYPPARRWIERELEHAHAKLDHQLDLMHHIIKHSDHIPDDDPLGRQWQARRPPRGRPPDTDATPV